MYRGYCNTMTLGETLQTHQISPRYLLAIWKSASRDHIVMLRLLSCCLPRSYRKANIISFDNEFWHSLDTEKVRCCEVDSNKSLFTGQKLVRPDASAWPASGAPKFLTSQLLHLCTFFPSTFHKLHPSTPEKTHIFHTTIVTWFVPTA